MLLSACILKAALLACQRVQLHLYSLAGGWAKLACSNQRQVRDRE